MTEPTTETLKRHSVDATVAGLLANTDGRRFLLWLFDLTGLFSNPLGTTDSLTNFNAGRQNVGQALLARLTEVEPMALARLAETMQQDAEMAKAEAKQ